MNSELQKILKLYREIIFKKDLKTISLENSYEDIKIDTETVKKYIIDKSDLVEKILEFERISFSQILDQYDFEEDGAIDIMLIVGRDLKERFYFINPTVTAFLRTDYREIYDEHFKKKVDFILEKIQDNLEIGMQEGVYRRDMPIKLLVMNFTARLLDLHNKEYFNYEKLSFDTVFEILFDSLIFGIATEEGKKYYKIKKKEYGF